MKKVFSHIAIYLLTATVLFASIGVNVHQFYCYCMGEMTASIFKPNNLCNAESVLECCKVKLANQVNRCNSNQDCSDCTSKYVHLDTDYLVFSADFQLDISQILPLEKSFAAQRLVPVVAVLVWENDLPPPPYGKSLLPHIQSFLC